MYYGQFENDEYREYKEIWSPKVREVVGFASPKKIKSKRS